MAVLTWNQAGTKFYETGVQNGVLYIRDNTGAYPLGVAWNGLISVAESPEGGDVTPFYADNQKYLELSALEELKATIEAYTYPIEFEQCQGNLELGVGVRAGQQDKSKFGLVYKTTLGNDTQGNSLGYKLHLVYNALAMPSEKSYQTINDSPEAITFSWELSTSPEPVSAAGMLPTSLIVIDSTKADQVKLQALEDELFGTAIADARLPLPDEVTTIFA